MDRKFLIMERSQKYTIFLFENSEGKISPRRLTSIVCSWEIIFKWILNKSDLGICTGSI
jgi:hypothetical protein